MKALEAGWNAPEAAPVHASRPNKPKPWDPCPSKWRKRMGYGAWYLQPEVGPDRLRSPTSMGGPWASFSG